MPDASDITEVTETADAVAVEDQAVDTADTFPRRVVEDLRRESAGYRDRARTAEARADELARQLHTELVRATGKLADASDLTFDAEHLGDLDKLTAAIDALTEAKPHLKSRRPAGSVGQGVKGHTTPEFSLLDRLKGNV